MIEGLDVPREGLSADEQRIIEWGWRTISSKQAKNLLLDAYYESHRPFRSLGISIPPQLGTLHAALGWPQKVVQALARKHIFEGYTLDGRTDPYDLAEQFARNDFTNELTQAIVAAYRHGCAFLTVTAGDISAGEPEVVVQARDAEWTTAHWNPRTRSVDAALAITATEPEPLERHGGVLATSRPSAFELFLPSVTVHARRVDGSWQIDRSPNPSGRVMVDVLAYDPQINRPFGHSRISREVRYLTDAAVRTLVRTEVSAEFFASPQRYLLGADEGAFMDAGRWTAYMGRVQAVDVNEEGDKPEFGQFPQMSMEPHLSMYRQLAQNLCAATGLPQSSVGLFADNPASAEAMQAAEVNLSDEAEYQWRVFSGPLSRVMQNMVMVRDGLSEPPAESWRMIMNWTPARYVSPQAASDFIVKTVQALPQVAGTTVALRRAGFTQSEIEEIEAQHQRQQAGNLVDRLLTGNRDEQTNDQTDQPAENQATTPPEDEDSA